MKRIGLLDMDMVFISRLQMAMNIVYPEEFEFIFFSNIKKLKTAVEKMTFDALLLNQDLIKDLNTIPRCTRYAFLLETRGHVTGLQSPAVCKYQSVEEWHTFLSEFCSVDITFTGGGDGQVKTDCSKTKVCLFTSASGGVGASSAAAAFCLHAASRKHSVIYVNAEVIPSTPYFFNGASYFDFGDIIYTLKGRKSNLDKMVQKSIVTDLTGVSFISPCKRVSDMLYLTGENIAQICDSIKRLGSYDIIVVDLNFINEESFAVPFITADKMVVVSNGDKIINAKTESLFGLISSSCGVSVEEIQNKSLILYNKFSPGTSEILPNQEYSKLGGINVCDFSVIKEGLSNISKLYPFERLLEVLNV